MFRMVFFKHGYSQETGKAKASQNTRCLDQNPAHGFQYLPLPESGPGYSNLRWPRVSSAPGTPLRLVVPPRPPHTLSPPPSESPPFSRQALPQRPLPLGPGRGGLAVPRTRLPQAPSLSPHPGPLPNPTPTWTSPGGWLLGILSSRCPAVTCGAADRQDRVGGGERG